MGEEGQRLEMEQRVSVKSPKVSDHKATTTRTRCALPGAPAMEQGKFLQHGDTIRFVVRDPRKVQEEEVALPGQYIIGSNNNKTERLVNPLLLLPGQRPALARALVGCLRLLFDVTGGYCVIIRLPDASVPGTTITPCSPYTSSK
ncbi:unnamed protein product [Choristocarpus tenellus]